MSWHSREHGAVESAIAVQAGCSGSLQSGMLAGAREPYDKLQTRWPDLRDWHRAVNPSSVPASGSEHPDSTACASNCLSFCPRPVAVPQLLAGPLKRRSGGRQSLLALHCSSRTCPCSIGNSMQRPIPTRQPYVSPQSVQPCTKGGLTLTQAAPAAQGGCSAADPGTPSRALSG